MLATSGLALPARPSGQQEAADVCSLQRIFVHVAAKHMREVPLSLDGFDRCCLGISDGFVREAFVYSVDRIVEQLESNGMSTDEAFDYFEYNVSGGWLGEGTPIFIREMSFREADETLSPDRCG